MFSILDKDNKRVITAHGIKILEATYCGNEYEIDYSYIPAGVEVVGQAANFLASWMGLVVETLNRSDGVFFENVRIPGTNLFRTNCHIKINHNTIASAIHGPFCHELLIHGIPVATYKNESITTTAGRSVYLGEAKPDLYQVRGRQDFLLIEALQVCMRVYYAGNIEVLKYWASPTQTPYWQDANKNTIFMGRALQRMLKELDNDKLVEFLEKETKEFKSPNVGYYGMLRDGSYEDLRKILIELLGKEKFREALDAEIAKAQADRDRYVEDET